MAEYLVQDSTLINIADAIRAKTGKTESIVLSSMADEISTITTGVELNYEVVGGTEAPSNPKENTIWVNTDVEITGWIFSVDEPANPIDGMMWFKTGISSSAAFATIEENPVIIYPLFGKQYVNGELAAKEAKSYQNGKWVDWIADITLYEAGTFSDKYAHKSLITPNTATLTYGSEYIIATTVASKANEVYEVFGPLSLDGYKSVSADMYCGDQNNIYGCILVADSDTASRTSAIAKTETNIAGGDSATLFLDVSEFDTSGDVYVYYGFTTNGAGWGYGRKDLRITNIRMEAKK